MAPVQVTAPEVEVATAAAQVAAGAEVVAEEAEKAAGFTALAGEKRAIHRATSFMFWMFP